MANSRGFGARNTKLNPIFPILGPKPQLPHLENGKTVPTPILVRVTHCMPLQSLTRGDSSELYQESIIIVVLITSEEKKGRGLRNYVFELILVNAMKCLFSF